MRTWTGARVIADRAFWAAQMIAAANDGSPLPCPFCRLPVTIEQQWDIEHAEKRIDGGALGRWNQRPAHRSCNRADGAAITNTRRTRRARRLRGR